MTKPPAISTRKADHIDLCTDGDVGFRAKTNLFAAVELIHNALPEIAVSDVDLRVEFAGKTLRAPLIMAAMTGGVDRAEAINRALASEPPAEGDAEELSAPPPKSDELWRDTQIDRFIDFLKGLFGK